jgi:VIT1/CCC1 family predicted Fe2+/Mn2+ transporter
MAQVAGRHPTGGRARAGDAGRQLSFEEQDESTGVSLPQPDTDAMSASDDIPRYRANLQAEIDGSVLYRAMAEGARSPELRALYQRLAETEEGHAELWRGRLTDAGATYPTGPTMRIRFLAALARRFGAGLVAGTVAGLEARDQTRYDTQPEAAGTSLAADERSHARLLNSLTGRGGAEGGIIARFEGRHRAIGGNALRAAVLGANDGLVSNFCLIMGVAGAGADRGPILIAGFAGLLAGSLSMALGEWLSVQSARELYANQLRIEASELEQMPEEEQTELQLIYEAKGMTPMDAHEMARRIVRGDRDSALNTMAREELGINPQELGGSPWVAALTSFSLFAVGAAIPLIPFMVATGLGAVVAATTLASLTLAGIGAAITVVTGQPALRSALRQLAFGVIAAAITYGIGRLLGTAIG